MATGPARADLPLTVEDLITDKDKFKLDLSLSYANGDRQGVSTGGSITIQTGPSAFVTLPVMIGESRVNSDTLVATWGLRYGLTSKAEIYTRASGLTHRQRSINVGGNTSSSHSRFADAWLGLNYQFLPNDRQPALLGFVEMALREKHLENSASLKSTMLGFTAYHAVDPMVFALTAAYRFNQTRRDGQVHYRPGKLLMISPSAGFAVNDRVTLTTGMQWTGRRADQINGAAQGVTRTSTALQLGVGYGIARGTTFNTTFIANASGAGGAEVRANWLQTF